jgi:hypothetical protein
MRNALEGRIAVAIFKILSRSNARKQSPLFPGAVHFSLIAKPVAADVLSILPTN